MRPRISFLLLKLLEWSDHDFSLSQAEITSPWVQCPVLEASAPEAQVKKRARDSDLKVTTQSLSVDRLLATKRFLLSAILQLLIICCSRLFASSSSSWARLGCQTSALIETHKCVEPPTTAR